MNESRELKNAEQLEELLLLTEEIQEELEQKDQLIVELKTQLSESLTLNEKLNKENRAGNIQALKNDLKLADRALRSEKEKLRSANVTIEECQDKIRCLTQQRDYARTHQKIVEIPVEKPVLYKKCEACDRTAYQNAKARYETQKEQLAGQYKAKTVMFQTTLFLLAWYSLTTTLFRQYSQMCSFPIANHSSMMQHHSYKLLSVGRLMPGNLWHKSAQKFQMRL